MSQIINDLFETFFLIKNSYWNTINLILLFFSGLTILLGILLYTFQSRLIYLPQLPPGSKEEVWLPSRFGYGPGKRDGDGDDKDDEDNLATWEELSLKTSDGEILQAYWIKSPSSQCDSSVRARTLDSKEESVPFTILYMQANAGNIVNFF